MIRSGHAIALFSLLALQQGGDREPRSAQILAAVSSDIDRVPPDLLERELEASPPLAADVLAALARKLSEAEPPHLHRLQRYVAAAASHRSRRLGERGAPWSEQVVFGLLELQFLDPDRFISDERFRTRVLQILPEAFDPTAPADLRDVVLFSVNNVPGVNFSASEAIEWAWGAAARRSAERELAYAAEVAIFTDEIDSRIGASFFSLSSSYFQAEETAELLHSLRRLAPERTIVVLIDVPLRKELEPLVRSLDLHLIENHGRTYSAWPRDPFSLVRRGDRGVTFLVRPNTQMQRVGDELMALELVQGLPENLDAEWGRARWARSPVPFHNGQLILGPEAAWVSLHSLETSILQKLRRERLPVETFAMKAGWRSYRSAALEAAGELEALVQRPLRFVHPLPSEEEVPSAALLESLGGGGGFDLDSVFTILREPSGTSRALVGDIDLGTSLLAQASLAELNGFAEAYGLRYRGEDLRERLERAQESARARGLDSFVELVAGGLAGQGIRVARLPLILVPVAALASDDFHHEDFLITWNNVVVESRSGARRAEGFRSLLSSGDALARRVFEDAGYAMDFLPPLIRSVVLNGGYRCASQHLRVDVQ